MKNTKRIRKQTIGNWLRKTREARGLTQNEVAEKLGLGNGQYISNVEHGRAPIATQYVKQLSKLYTISEMAFIDRLSRQYYSLLVDKLGV